MFEIDILDAISFGDITRVLKVIHIDIINEVRSLCFRGALSPALFFFKGESFEKVTFF